MPNGNPMPKPCKRILRNQMRELDVLDPFMGTGSTGVASLMLNRGFIGIEQDLEWFDIAQQRLMINK